MDQFAGVDPHGGRDSSGVNISFGLSRNAAPTCNVILIKPLTRQGNDPQRQGFDGFMGHYCVAYGHNGGNKLLF